MYKGKTMLKKKLTGTNLESLMDLLASKDGLIRQKARKSLVTLGKPAVSSLIEALQNSMIIQLRWEAAKTLGVIGDTRAIPALVDALEDNDTDVTWVAAEALKKFKKAAWPQVLRMLIKSKSNSVLLHEGAHHIFWKQKEDGFNDLLATLIKALDSNSVQDSITLTAYAILKRMKVKL
jgi:hypothetical protein